MGFQLDDNGKPIYNNDITDPVGQLQEAANYAERAVAAALKAVAAERRARYISAGRGTAAGLTPIPADADIKEYFFHTEPRTDANGRAQITWPTALPNAIGGVFFTTLANSASSVVVNGGNLTRTGAGIVVPNQPNTDVRLSVLYWGW